MIGGLGIFPLSFCPLKLLYPDLFVCLGDKEAFIFDVLVHQVDWVFRSWNLRLHRDFHDWELEAVFSFLEHVYSRFSRVEGIDRIRWCLKGSGQFDSLFIRWFGQLLSLHFHGRVFGLLRFLKGLCSLWERGCLWWTSVVCVEVMGSQWIIFYCIVMLPMLCGGCVFDIWD